MLEYNEAGVKDILQQIFGKLRTEYPSNQSLGQVVEELLRLLGSTGDEYCRIHHLDHTSAERFSANFDTLEQMEVWFQRTFSVLLEENERNKSERKEQTAQMMMREIECSYNDFTLSLETLAKRFGYSKSYCSDLFKKATGYSVVEYITKCRMNQAQKLLYENPNIKVSEICKQVGYQNQFYFSRRFKQYFGVAPGRIADRRTEE